MVTLYKTVCMLQKAEFEARIFISLSVVMVISLLSFLCFPSTPMIMVISGNWFGWSSELSMRIGYLFVALLMLMASLLRISAGSTLTSVKVMSFKVRLDKLVDSGPYILVRNPIYLADFIAFIGFTLCLKPIGLLLPILIYIHYSQLVAYEEKSLASQFNEQFVNYKSITPRFVPSPDSIYRFFKCNNGFNINFDGFRHNALFLLFIPGFVVSAITGSLYHAILIGIPAVLDWAVIHTVIGLPSKTLQNKEVSPRPKAGLLRSKIFSDILYAQCWEDPAIDREAFGIRPDDEIFSITSGGCNVLTFLLDDPAKVVALDINPAQNFLLDLKMAAFRRLQYNNMLQFLGVTASDQRLNMYKELRPELQKNSRDYWDRQHDKIRKGIIHTGRFEGYMHMLSKWFRILVGRSLFRQLFEAEKLSDREMLYKESWNNRRWRFFTGFFLSRFWMTILFDKAFFAQIERSVSFGEHFRRIIEKAITKLPVRENSYLAYILFGNYYSPDHFPPYLRRENYEIIRQRLCRIQIITGNCESYFASLPENYFSKFNFTNIFEWMSLQAFENLLRETVRVARNGSIITYRNLLVPRSRPENLAEWIKPKRRTAEKLHGRDLSFIYRAYIVEQIVKKDVL